MTNRDSLGRFVGGRSNPAFVRAPPILANGAVGYMEWPRTDRERLLDQAVRNVRGRVRREHWPEMPNCATCHDLIRAEFARLAKGG